MSEEITALFEQLKSVDVDTFHDTLKTGAPDHYNKVFRMGFGTAKGEFDKKSESSKSRIEELEADLKSRDEKIKTLSEKSPDVAKIEARYEEALKAKAAEIEQIKAKMTEELSQRDEVVLGERKSTFNANFVRHLVELGVDKDYAEVLAAKSDVQARIKWGDDRNPKVYQEDGQTPFPQADSQKPYEVLAADVLKLVPNKFVEEKKPRESGFGNFKGMDLQQAANLSGDQLEAALEKAWSGRL